IKRQTHRRIASGIRGVTGELDYEEGCICGCHRCDRGLSGCGGDQEEEKGSACSCDEQREQQREQLEVRQGLPADLPAELVDPALYLAQEPAVVPIGTGRHSAREPESRPRHSPKRPGLVGRQSTELISDRSSTMPVLRTGIVFILRR